ncbi:MAG: 3-deoxy-D-manno-octulosonic acid transferase [Maricaulaceae bacterium]
MWRPASTHEGEEALLCDALDPADEAELLILAPRHPDRGDALADMLDARGLAFARRSIGEAPLSAHKVLLADTLGEMGLWLRLSRMAFIGGSWVDGVGGHNPVEAARLATPMAVGPYTANFTTLYNDLEAAGGCARVRTTDELRTALNTVFSDVTRGRRYADAAIGVVDAATAAWPKTLDALEALWTQRRTEDAEMTEAGADA